MLDFIEDRMRHPGGRGLLHRLPADRARLQNPHMHLLEACIAGFEASGHAASRRWPASWLRCSIRASSTPERGTLGEYFDENCNRAGGDAGHHVERGHHYFWVWCLAAAGRLFGLPVEAEMRALARFAEWSGIDAAGAVRNAVRDDGTVLDGGSRAWPNTERVKAAVALSGALGDETSGMLDQSLTLLLDRYLHADGGWTDAFDAGGRPAARAMPVSSCYCVFLAIVEAGRVTGYLAAPRPPAPVR
jgi:N-acylglucosamine 2-epimerase/mannose-6-phosphate isomerase